MNGTTPPDPQRRDEPPRRHDEPASERPNQQADRPAGHEPTAVFPTFGQAHQGGGRGVGGPGPSYPAYGPNLASPPPGYGEDAGVFGSPTRATSPPPREPKRRRGAGIVVAAVLAGGLAGVAGAVGYDALTGEESTTPTSVTEPQSPSAPVTDSEAAQGSVEAVAAAVLPSVVKIDVAAPGGSGSGSGFILTADGTIVTNNHVVEAATAGGGTIMVSFNDGTTADAEVVGTDPLTDLAVIKAEGVSGLTPASLGTSGGLDVGEEVVAVGSPFGLESTVTSGIVSAVNRPVSTGGQGSVTTTFPAIQTDAAINPGNSGGPLVNMRGEVVGINTAIRSTSGGLGGQPGSIGLGFAIPIDEAKPIVDQLAAGEQATHARLGVTVGTPTNAEGRPVGAEVQTVEPGSAADEAGLRPGDVITKIDDHVISSSDGLVAMVRSYRPGDTVTLTVVRDGDEQQVEATLGSDEGDNNT